MTVATPEEAAAIAAEYFEASRVVGRVLRALGLAG